jgi:hypothetical protein
LINIKRLAYVVRKPEEAFEMPLDYDAAPTAPAPGLMGPIDRGAVVAAVERYLASRGIAVVPSAGGKSCGCEPAASAAQPTAVAQHVIGSVAADVVDRFLARRGTADSKAGFS